MSTVCIRGMFCLFYGYCVDSLPHKVVVFKEYPERPKTLDVRLYGYPLLTKLSARISTGKKRGFIKTKL